MSMARGKKCVGFSDLVASTLFFAIWRDGVYMCVDNPMVCVCVCVSTLIFLWGGTGSIYTTRQREKPTNEQMAHRNMSTARESKGATAIFLVCLSSRSLENGGNNLGWRGFG